MNGLADIATKDILVDATLSRMEANIPMPFQQLVTGTGDIFFIACRDAAELKYGHVCMMGSWPLLSRSANVS